jgi:hypothetical protein
MAGRGDGEFGIAEQPPGAVDCGRVMRLPWVSTPPKTSTSGLVMMETAVLFARTDETARTEPDEADKTVMGASRTGSYEVTDVEPGDVQRTGPPRSVSHSQ